MILSDLYKEHIMKRSHSVLHWFTFITFCMLAFTGVILVSCWMYTTVQLRAARQAGLYSSAEEGMRAMIAQNYIEPERSQVIYAGTNSFDGSDPHVWYAIACVWGGHRLDGSTPGSARHAYDQPGWFFLNTRDGWVFVPEGVLPGFIGFWMKVFGLAGPGSSHPSHDWGSAPQGDCVF
jgi:hypothetical protein